jgi:chromosome segregation ATPase
MASSKLQEVKSKFAAFILEVERLRTELKVTQNEVQNLKKQLAEKQDELVELHHNLSNRNIAEAVVGHNGIEAGEAKQKITELMREIDRCIALLNV